MPTNEVHVRSLVAAGPSTPAVIAELDEQVDLAPDAVFAFYGQSHDDRALFDYLSDRFPDAALIGGTSSSGVMSERGLGGADSIGLLLVEDPQGAYGAAATELGDDPAGAAEAALQRALEAADSPGELPELVWIYQCPGHEEAVVEGLRRVIGDRCPVIGGSSADDSVAGQWRQLGPGGPLAGGLAVGVLFSSGGIGFAFEGGYEPTGASGLVTAVEGRHILEIDGEPAVDVYNRWTGALPESALAVGGTILAETTMRPLGIDAGHIDEVRHFRLVHPDAVTPERGLTTFAQVDPGARIYGMRGDRERLVQRVGRVASAAIGSLHGADVAGGLVVYCAGCMLAVGDRGDQVSETAARAFGGSSFLGCFTFGEQGVLLDRNVHGNLMISAIAFGA